MSEENVEVVRKVWDLWERGPEQGNLGVAWDHGLAAPNAMLSPPPEVPDMETYVGRDGFVEFFGIWTAAFDDWTIRAERIIDAGDDRVVLIAHQSAAGKGSGARVELRSGIVYTLEDERITRIEMYVSPEQALEAAGLRE